MSFESNAVYFTKWMDNKSVYMLSNFLATLPVQNVQRKKKKSSGKDVVKCPFVVKQYSKHMGDVDLMDQKKVTYQFDHRPRYKFYFRLVHDLLDIAINNAGIVYNRVSEQSEQLDLKTYWRMVAQALIGNYSSRKRQLSSSSILKTPQRARQMKDCRGSTQHTMQKVSQRKRCKLCTSNNLESKTDNMCVECNVHLCYVNGRDCFALYHS